MEETTKKPKTISEKMCGIKDCDTCGHRHHHHHPILRMVLTIFIVILVFWCGLKIGELKGFIIANQTSFRPVQFQMVSPDMKERSFKDRPSMESRTQPVEITTTNE